MSSLLAVGERANRDPAGPARLRRLFPRGRSPSGRSAATGAKPSRSNARRPPGCPSADDHTRTRPTSRRSLEPADELGCDRILVDVRCELDVAPPERRVGAVRVDVDIPDEPPVLLEDADVALDLDRGRGQPGAQLVLRHVGLAERGELMRVHQLEHRVEVVVLRRPERHSGAGTSSSSASGSPERSGSSRSGSGSASSPSRLIQTIFSPSSRAGATSWKRLAPTWTWCSRSAVVSSKKRSSVRARACTSRRPRP